MLVVDASVWIIAASPGERGHADSFALVDRVTSVGSRLVLPRLAYVEVAATMARMRGDAALGRRFADAIVQLPFVSWVDLDRNRALSTA